MPVGMAQYVLSVRISAVDRLTATLRRVIGDVGKFGDRLKSIGRFTSTWVTAPLTVLGVVSARTAIKMEDSFAQIRAILGKTDEQIQPLRASLHRMADDAKVGVDQVVTAFQRLLAGGNPLSEALKGAPVAIDLKRALGLETAAEAAGFLDDLDDAFHGMIGPAREVADAIVKGVRAAGSTVPSDFVNSLAAVAELGTAAGFTLTRDLLPAVVAVKRSGNDVSEFASAIQKLVDVGAITGKESLDDVLKRIRASGLDSAQMIDFFGKRAHDAIAVLVRDPDVLARIRAELDGISPTAKQAGFANDGLSRSLETLSAQWVKFQVAIADGGVIPALTTIAVLAGDVMKWFTELSPSTQKWLVIAAGAGAAFGPLLTGLGAIVGVLAAVNAPLTLVAGAVVALAGAATWLYSKLFGDDEPSAVPQPELQTVAAPRAMASQAHVTLDINGAPAGSRLRTSGDAKVDANLGYRTAGN